MREDKHTSILFQTLYKETNIEDVTMYIHRLIGLQCVEVYAINNFSSLFYLSIEIDCIDEDYFSQSFFYYYSSIQYQKTESIRRQTN